MPKCEKCKEEKCTCKKCEKCEKTPCQCKNAHNKKSITISKTQWELIGQKTNWLKESKRN